MLNEGDLGLGSLHQLQRMNMSMFRSSCQAVYIAITAKHAMLLLFLCLIALLARGGAYFRHNFS